MILNTKKTRGFTLIEVAIVLLIMGFLLGALMTPMGAQRENNNIKQARQELKTIQEAILGFAIANRRLPCPATPGSGLENPNTGGVCLPGFMGFVPSTSLGLDGNVNCDGLMLDPWGNPYRYSVTSVGAPDFTTVGEIVNVGPAALNPDIQICKDNNCVAAEKLTNKAVAVIYSMGSNWSTLGGVDETENAETTIASTCGLANYAIANDNEYVSHDRVEAGANQFNDIVSWISANILYAKLLAAGIL